MSLSRRTFLSGVVAAPGASFAVGMSRNGNTVDSSGGNMISSSSSASFASAHGFDANLEVDASALRQNAAEVSRLCGGRPIMAVVKNNGYGLGLTHVGPILDECPEITALAVVKPDQAIALRDSGVRKPILLMGMYDSADLEELVHKEVRLTPWNEGMEESLSRLAVRLQRPIPIQLYLDTGMGRVGIPYRRALPWIERIAAKDEIQIEGMFTAFTEEEFDREQLDRLLEISRRASSNGVELGDLHAASSHGCFFRPHAYLDMVRPGLVLFGGYPAGGLSAGTADLTPAVKFQARIVRVEQLEAGDGVNYGRNYVAEKPTWTATLPVGHADGYPRSAVNGCKLLVNGKLYPVIGAVSASHTIIEIGENKEVEVGDRAVFIGPDDPAVWPNTIAETAGISVYDVLMHLSARIPKRIIDT